jgi:NDP-sugar pyrophosphorylase family protein
MPKPMIQIAGRPILEHTLARLADHGVRDVVVNLHHCPEAVTSAIGDGSRWDMKITYSYEAELLGTAGTVAAAGGWIDSTTLVVYGDNLTTCDIGGLVKFHHAHNAVLTMAVHHRDELSGAGIVEVLDDDRIGRFVEKPKPEDVFSHWVNAGLLVVEPAVLPFVPDKRPADLSYDVIPELLKARDDVFAYRFGPAERLWWIDRPADLDRVQREFSAGRQG